MRYKKGGHSVLFVRLQAENKKFVSQQSKKKKVSASMYVDELITRMRQKKSTSDSAPKHS